MTSTHPHNDASDADPFQPATMSDDARKGSPVEDVSVTQKMLSATAGSLLTSLLGMSTSCLVPAKSGILTRYLSVNTIVFILSIFIHGLPG